mgnify:CR=1 FL=1
MDLIFLSGTTELWGWEGYSPNNQSFAESFYLIFIWQSFVWIDRNKDISDDLRSSKFQNFLGR